MPHQLWFPFIPADATAINDEVHYARRAGELIYYLSCFPIFQHKETDKKSLAMFTSSLICQGLCKQAEIQRAFGLCRNTVRRNVERYRTSGASGFFEQRRGRGASVLKVAVLEQAQSLLFEGLTQSEMANRLGIKKDTLRKAIADGRLIAPKVKDQVSGRSENEAIDTAISDQSRDFFEDCTVQPIVEVKSSDLSTRSKEDEKAGEFLGIACTRVLDRVAAAVGLGSGAQTIFEPCKDVPLGGFLCAIPALESNGLFKHLECFGKIGGYYNHVIHILITLAIMALCRIKSVEQLQYQSPGEMGKLMGLDRVPEVRTFRKKLSQLCFGGTADVWSKMLCRDWMEQSPELSGVLYVDGHVRVYHGEQTELPRRFVSRERLCLRGTTDYWVNDALGQPFFLVEKVVDEGMLAVLRKDIVPRLLADVPNQPSETELEASPYLARFVLVFDREGYSPAFFKEMWKNHRIACLTYRKNVKDAWPIECFEEKIVEMRNGEKLSMMLAEKGTFLGDAQNGLWVKEIRKLNPSGKQTAIVTTAYGNLDTRNAGLMFSRWAQENYFAYMMKHFAIDRLMEIGTTEFPGPQTVVNPAWRQADKNVRLIKSNLDKLRAKYTENVRLNESKPPQEQQPSPSVELVEAINDCEENLKSAKETRGKIPKHIDWSELTEEQKFFPLATAKKRLADTVKMICYRAETAMMNIVRERLARKNDARSVIRDLLASTADITPDLNAGLLHVSIHSMANPRTNEAIAHLIEHLNSCEAVFPMTNLHLKFHM